MESQMNSRPLLQQNSDDSGEAEDYLVADGLHKTNANVDNVDDTNKNDENSSDDADANEDDDITVDIIDKQLLLKHKHHNHIPKDKYNYNYIIFYLLGMTTLIPWNFFITSEAYWMYKFRNITNNSTDELTPIQTGFTSDLSVASAVPNTIFLILNVLIGYRIPIKYRMNVSLVIMLIFFIITTCLVQIDTDQVQYEFFVFTLSTAVIMNVAAAVMSGGLFGISGLFPSKYVSAVVSGQALGGIFAALAEILALTFGASAKISGFVYFMIGNFVLCIALISYIIMSKTLYFKYNTIEKLKLDKEISDAITTSSSSALDCDTNEGSPTISAASTITMSSAFRTIPVTGNITDVTRSSSPPPPPLTEPNFRIILSKIWIYGLSEWFVFVVTLSIYPSVTVLVNSQTGKGNVWNDIYFVPVVNYLIFNTGDYVGRIIAGILEWPRNRPRVVAVLSFLRIFFIPILLLCNTNPRHNLPVFIHSDYIFILLMGLFSLTNGYIANIALIWAPKIVHGREKELASSMMAAFLGVGLACGSMLSLVFVKLL